MVLNRKKIERFFPSDDNDNYVTDGPYTADEIRQLLDKADVRARVVVLLMVSTGMRLDTVHQIRISDIKKFNEFNLYLINVYANSKKNRYYTFCNPECAKAIDEYLAYRKRLGEVIKERFITAYT